MKWNEDVYTGLEIVPADEISNLMCDHAFVDVYVKSDYDESFCILTKEQTKELVDYLLGLLGEKREQNER